MPTRTLRDRATAAPQVRRRTAALLGTDPRKLAAYPTLRKAASILGVDPGTLSRREDVQEQGIHRGNTLLLPTELTLRLAQHYHRRRFSEVASALMALAVAGAPDYVAEIEAEIDAVFEQAHTSSSPRQDAEAFLREAKRTLPADLYAQVVAEYTSGREMTAGSAYLGDD
jgi:hypothetical protein